MTKYRRYAAPPVAFPFGPRFRKLYREAGYGNFISARLAAMSFIFEGGDSEIEVSDIRPLLNLAKYRRKHFRSLIKRWKGGSSFSELGSSYHLRSLDGRTYIGRYPVSLNILLRNTPPTATESTEVAAGISLGMTAAQARASESSRRVTWDETPMFCLFVAHLDESEESLRRASKMFDVVTSQPIAPLELMEEYSLSSLDRAINQPELDGPELRDDLSEAPYELFNLDVIRSMEKLWLDNDLDRDDLLTWQVLRILIVDISDEEIVKLALSGSTPENAYRKWRTGLSVDAVIRTIANDIDNELAHSIFKSRYGSVWYAPEEKIYVELISQHETEAFARAKEDADYKKVSELFRQAII
jgi:hypothetical protein